MTPLRKAKQKKPVKWSVGTNEDLQRLLDYLTAPGREPSPTFRLLSDHRGKGIDRPIRTPRLYSLPEPNGEPEERDLTKCPEYGKSKWACRRCKDISKCWPTAK